ncbi:E2/UBC family protein [Novosphingobium sp. PY1]|uniref:E2/UBC family protein n=1 Tax=Novosphingobium sp. PY1 TaxID=1882221 RepID=UPI001A8CB6AC|nr:E2/UBC family protein [Novosphingobium sp. PY1]GFM31604.1 uncharacterized protein PY1_contig-29-16 [Novosphingobium sp. PY1]
MRRDFDLGPDDARALDALEYRWETVRSGGAMWVVIHDFPIPVGFNVGSAKVAIRVDTYPPGPIDMAYFSPPLARADGQRVNNLSAFTIEGEEYQQWSRHYAWNSARDTLGTHVRRVRGWLKHELRKR